MTRAIIDADTMVYAAGFAVAKTAGPVSHACNAVDMTVQSVIDTLRVDSYELYLTGSEGSDPRKEILPTYKANRVGMPKPPHYEEMREHLVVRWGAEVCTSMEADDLVSIQGYSDVDNVMVSIDKDLLNTPGFHYHWKKGELQYVDMEQAWRNFYKQTLIGDTADNVKGVPGIGTVKAGKLMDHLSTEEDLYAAAAVQHGKAGLGLEDFHTTCRVLWIAREIDVFGNPVGWNYP